MSFGCTSPLYRVPFGTHNFNLLSGSLQNRLRNGGVFLPLEDYLLYSRFPSWNVRECQVLRCGQCANCRLAYSRDWAVRCSLEAEMHEFNYFITLTYDDFHLPKGEFLDFEYNVHDSNLCRRDIQLFIKNLREHERKYYGNTGIKVFYCGEYGTLNSRPHYHIIVMGVSEIPDLTFSFRKDGNTFYKSSLYERFWSSDKSGVKIPQGFVDISECTFNTIAYTARYCLKKIQGVMKKGFLVWYESLDDGRPDIRLSPFVGMSLKPGIAAEYFEKSKGLIYQEDLVKYHKKFELYCCKPPRYFDKLYEREDPDAFAKLKDHRLDIALAAKASSSSRISEEEHRRLERERQISESKVMKYYSRC